MQKTLYLCSLLIVFFITSCVSLITDIGADAIANMSPSEIREYQQTLDPSTKLSKRNAIYLMAATNGDKLSAIQQNASNVASNVGKPSYKNVKDFVFNTGNADIKCFLMYPKTYKKGKLYPCIFFSHGGSFESGDFSNYEFFLKEFVNRTDCIVLFDEYRLAPEYKFPVGVNDTYDVYTKWLINKDNSEVVKECGIDTSKIVLMGDSSGGNFAAGLAIRLAENKLPLPIGVVLLYPSVNVSGELNYSRLAFSGINGTNDYMTNLEYLSHIMNDVYLNSPDDAYKPYASPLFMLLGLIKIKGWTNPYIRCKANLTPPLSNFPPHFIVLPEVDALRDEGKMYNAALCLLGVDSTFKEYKGTGHTFSMTTGFIESATRSVDDVSLKIKEWINE